MKTVLVTGPIGGGKSEACRYFASQGYPVYDCDSRCKALYQSIPGLKERIEEELGIPFDMLAIIFSDDTLREKLENLVYPLLLDDLRQWLTGLGDASRFAFVESAVASDRPGFNFPFDRSICITASYYLRLERNPKVAVRDSLQHFNLEKFDAVVYNDKSMEDLYASLDEIIDTVL